MKTTLKVTNANLFKSYLEKTVAINATDLLNFTFNDKKVFDVVSNISMSLFKKWELDIDSFASIENPPSENIKVSLYKGKEFIRNILGFFNDEFLMEFEHNNGKTSRIVLVNDQVKIPVVCADSGISYIEYDKETLETVFGNDDQEIVSTFQLSNGQRKNILNMARLQTSPEEKNEFITFQTNEEDYLTASDGAFHLKLHKMENKVEDVKVSTGLLHLFDNEDFTIKIKNNGDKEYLHAFSENTNTTISLILISDEDTNDDEFAEEFEFSDEEINWE